MFVKGQPRPPGAGRKPGSRNRATPVKEMLRAKGIDLIEELTRTLEDLRGRDRAAVLLRLMDYVYPKVKATEPEDLARDVTPTAAPDTTPTTPEELAHLLTLADSANTPPKD
jgi:hypothetical protein